MIQLRNEKKRNPSSIQTLCHESGSAAATQLWRTDPRKSFSTDRQWSSGKNRPEPFAIAVQRGGTSSYHPKMLLKVLVYAYAEKVYSSRRIAKALRENLHYMWISGGSRPDFRTLNNLRSPARWIHFSFPLMEYRRQARENLTSELGRELRTKRATDVETVFGCIKHNMGFRRFHLRGLEKVNIEWGFVSIAHNMRKLAAI